MCLSVASNAKHSILGNNRLIYVCNGRHKDGSYICGNNFEPTHGNTGPHALDSHHDNCEILKKIFELQTTS